MSRHRKHDPRTHADGDNHGTPGGGPPVKSQLFSAHAGIPEILLRFLNALPATGDAATWVASFSTLLASVLADVDLVVVRVNLHCRLVAAPDDTVDALGRRDPISLLASVLATGTIAPTTVPLEVTAPAYDSNHYHPPVRMEFHHSGDDLGAIALLRLREAEAISQASIGVVQELEPFLQFALTDLVARYAYAKPMSRVFHDVLDAIAGEVHLTSRELEVLTLHMFGRKYAEIATRLHISIDTVKKHVKKIHRKTGARSATELFARYFAPLVDIDDPNVRRRSTDDEQG